MAEEDGHDERRAQSVRGHDRQRRPGASERDERRGPGVRGPARGPEARGPVPVAGAVLVAPDAFKGTFSARAVTEAISAGLAGADLASDACPLADGGEGTSEVLLGALGGECLEVSVSDPLGRPLDAPLALLGDGRTAVVEVAAASGLALLGADERDAAAASTRGTGELVLAAVATGARTILVGAGGSASTDGGLGAIEAIREGGGLRGARIEVLCDTEEPFELAAAVFAPQKGADTETVAMLERRLRDLAGALPRDPRGKPHSGAAGGLAGGLWAAFDATLGSGAMYLLDAVGAPARAAASRAVVSGEGRLDGQSVHGKLVGAVAAMCSRIPRPLAVIAGRVELGEQDRLAAGISWATEATTLVAIEGAARRWGSELRSG